MKNKFIHFIITKAVILIILISLQTKLLAQSEQTFYITNTTYEAYQIDKVPFGMRKLVLQPTDDSLSIADKTFYKNTLKDGNLIYLTADRKSYLLTIEKPEQVGFIVCPNGKDWSCYFRYKKGKKEKNIPPPDLSNEEAGLLKEAVGKIVDPKIKFIYITYSSFISKANTYFAEDSLPVVFVSADTITVGANNFIKKADRLYVSPGHTYLYMPDNQTLVFRDPDMSGWASFYQKDLNKANHLISQEYKSEKELKVANTAIAEMSSTRLSKVVNNYFSNKRSQKNDPILTNAILKYWNGRWPGSPAYAVVYVDNDFSIVKNNVGITLRKSITTWVIYKMNGKCYAKWHEYGYEALGGGTFTKEINQWQMSNREFSIETGSLNLFSGEQYELDCSIIK